MKVINLYLNSNNQEKKEVISEVIKAVKKQLLLPLSFRIFIENLKINISETPLNNLTAKGAYLRAKKIQVVKNDSQTIYVGMESGLVRRNKVWFEECWVCLLYQSKKYYGYSSGLMLPKKIVEQLNTKRHVAIMKELEKVNNLSSKDTWGHYTKKIIPRRISFYESFRNAFISFLIENFK